jgi:hypothetical protein
MGPLHDLVKPNFQRSHPKIPSCIQEGCHSSIFSLFPAKSSTMLELGNKFVGFLECLRYFAWFHSRVLLVQVNISLAPCSHSIWLVSVSNNICLCFYFQGLCIHILLSEKYQNWYGTTNFFVALFSSLLEQPRINITIVSDGAHFAARLCHRCTPCRGELPVGRGRADGKLKHL